MSEKRINIDLFEGFKDDLAKNYRGEAGPDFESEKKLLINSDEPITPRHVRENSFYQSSQLAFENWEETKLLSGRIIKKQSKFVHCEYVEHVNDKPVFKVRKFPSMLFEHIQNLAAGKYVKLKICLKPGVSKVEIHDGRGLGIEKDFEQKDIWKGLENMKMDEPPKRK